MSYKFISYGDKKFIESRSRIKKEAEDLGIFDSVEILDRKQLENWDKIKEAKKNPDFRKVWNTNQGGGCYMWKPFILHAYLNTLNDDEILFYMDAGSTITNNDNTRNKLFEYANRVTQSHLGCLGFLNPHQESKYTKGEVFDHFKVRENPWITKTRQYSAGILHVMRKTEHSLKIYKLWRDTAINHPLLFTNLNSASKNFPEFVANRHDQSVWSIICKTKEVITEFDWQSVPILATRKRE